MLRAWRYPDGVYRLVPSPAFVLSPVRSGSTLLRVLLNSHSQVCAPHEMHLQHVRVTIDDFRPAQLAVAQLQLSAEELEHLLWDRIMHRELQRSGKSVFVDKTPQNGSQWERLAAAWPDAVWIFLQRHPASVVESMLTARPDLGRKRHERLVLAYGAQMEAARAALGGLTVRYEDLTADPEKVTRRLCAYLGVPWERQMLDYGYERHGPFKSGLGDWSSKIRSGRVQAAAPLPAAEDVPETLRKLASAWCYL